METVDLTLFDEDGRELARWEGYAEIDGFVSSASFDVEQTINDADNLAYESGIDGWDCAKLLLDSGTECGKIRVDDEWGNYQLGDRRFTMSAADHALWSVEGSSGEWIDE